MPQLEKRYRTPAFDDLGFATHYACRALARSTSVEPYELPDEFFDLLDDDYVPNEIRAQVQDLSRVARSTIPPEARILSEAIALEVTPAGVPWVREYSGMDWRHYHTGLYGTPAADQVLVVAGGDGYWVPVRMPDAATPLHVAPVLGVCRVPDREILLCWSFQDLAAYGPEGLLWYLEDLSIDDLRITEVRQNSIHGTNLKPSVGPDPYVPEEHIPFTVDPLTGHVEGGWYTSEVKLRRPSDEVGIQRNRAMNNTRI